MSSESESTRAASTPGAAAQIETERILAEEQAQRIEEPLGDPEPPEADATKTVKEKYYADLKKYSDEMLDCFINNKWVGEQLWIEFTCTFRQVSITHMNSRSLADWIQHLRSNGVFVLSKRGYPRVKALKECLTSNNFTPSTLCMKNDETCNTSTIQEKQLESIFPHNKITSSEKNQQNHSKCDHDSNVHDTNRSYGLHSLMKAFNERSKFSGSFTEDFQTTVEKYETLANLFNVGDNELAIGFPIMLTGSAFNHYTRNFKKSNLTYDELIDKFKSWYTSEEQRYRLLKIWQHPSLQTQMERNPECSELEVFKKLTDELATVQHQLDSSYHNERFLRDQLMIAADIPHLQRALIDKVPKTAQEAMQRIGALLSSEPKSARGNITTEESHFTVGSKYGGKARKDIRYKGGGKQRRGSHIKYLASVKGCWVCGKDHQAKGNHNQSEILDALNRLKRKRDETLFTLDHVFELHEIFKATSNEDSNESDSEDSTSEDESVHFNTEDTEEKEINSNAEVYLSNSSFLHGRSFCSDTQKELKYMDEQLSIGESNGFDGIILDTGANRKSAMSLNQYKAYCRTFHIPVNINSSDQKKMSGIGGIANSVGTATIFIPFNELGITIEVEFRILEAECRSLLSLRDMITNGLDISLQRREITLGTKTQKLSFIDDFLQHKWNPYDVALIIYDEKELKKLHRSFGHPHIGALSGLLKRADPAQFNTKVKETLKKIQEECSICRKFSSKPRRFKLTVGTHDLRFNHILAVDLMFIDGRSILHCVDEATHYTAAVFMKNNTSEETWKCLRRCWIQTYLGPPDHLRVDQGSNFVSKHFKGCAEAEGISILEAPIECPTSMTHVERYHAPLRAAYKKIREMLPRSENDNDCLKMAVKSVNDTIGPEGLVPTLLVYGSIPRPPRATCAASQIERAKALDAAMDSVQREQAKRKLQFASKHTKGPKRNEQEINLQGLPAGSFVLIYRQKSKVWEGPFQLISVDGNTAVIQMKTGRKLFRTNVVKPFNNAQPCPSEESLSFTPFHQMGNGSESIFQTSVVKPCEEHDFVEARKKELRGLFSNNTLCIVKRDSVPKGMRIYGTRWVHALKSEAETVLEKSRLVAQNFKDKQATEIPTGSPTISRMGQRVCLSTASSNPDHESFLRDITQAYPQSDKELLREVYLEPPPELGLSDDTVLLVLKALYGIPESGLHWFVTYSEHHLQRLDMQPSKSDKCLMYNRKEKNLEGVIILQVDDSLGHGTSTFLDLEERESKRFTSKPRKMISKGSKVEFNGCDISRNHNNVYSMTQTEKLKQFKQPTCASDLVSARAKIQYIGSCTRPDLCSPSQLLATEVLSPDKKTYHKLEQLASWCNETSNIGLNYVPLDVNSMKLTLFTDASFANTSSLKSQMGFVLVLSDDQNNANIVHYGSNACKRVTRSVMAAELLGLVYGYDSSYIVKCMLQDIFGIEISLDILIDSRTVFNVVAKSSSTQEKRLQIDIHSLRESILKKEIRHIGWIPGLLNVADGLTKGLIDKLHALWKLMTTNKLDVKPEGWMTTNGFIQKENS